jgi:hypothetical protein
MSEARLELVEPCEHGYVELPNDQSRHAQSTVPGGCPGGSRRVLSDGEFLFLERPTENKRWPDWVAKTCLEWARSDTTDVLDLLDMLVESAHNAPATLVRPGAGQT